MMWWCVSLGIILLIHGSTVDSSLQLYPGNFSSNGFICPPATFNCIATDFSSEIIRWYINDTIVALYTNGDDEYPFDVTLSSPIPGVIIQIIQASFNAISNSFNYHSTMTANMSVLIQEGASNITCGIRFTRSNLIAINNLSIYFEVPSAPVIDVMPIYNQLSELSEVIVQWEDVQDECGDLVYRIKIINASGHGVIVNQIEIDSGCGVCMDDQCSTPLCSTSFGYDENYSISVTAYNVFGSSPPAIFNDTIVCRLCAELEKSEETPELSRVEEIPFGVESPNMVQFKDVTECQICATKISLSKKNNCSTCGKAACDKCSEWKAYLPYKEKEGRVCVTCYNKSLKENQEHEVQSVGVKKRYPSSSGNIQPQPQPQMNEMERMSEEPINIPVQFVDSDVVYDEIQEFTLHSNRSRVEGDQVTPIELRSNCAYHASTD